MLTRVSWSPQILSYIQIYALALSTSSSVANLTAVSLMCAHCLSSLELPDTDDDADICGGDGVGICTVVVEAVLVFVLVLVDDMDSDVAGLNSLFSFSTPTLTLAPPPPLDDRLVTGVDDKSDPGMAAYAM